jgi:hypothetical protein
MVFSTIFLSLVAQRPEVRACRWFGILTIEPRAELGDWGLAACIYRISDCLSSGGSKYLELSGC